MQFSKSQCLGYSTGQGLSKTDLGFVNRCIIDRDIASLSNAQIFSVSTVKQMFTQVSGLPYHIQYPSVN